MKSPISEVVPLQDKIEKLYSNMICKRTYTRWLHEEGRRESWNEAVTRYRNYFSKYVPKSLIADFEQAIYFMRDLQVMGSMRALWSAGPALEENSFANYNCSYFSIDGVDKFSELLYVLMHGTGCGFSVERQYINQLPEFPNEFVNNDVPYIIADSKLGWKEAVDHCFSYLQIGRIPQFDYSLIRPKGSILKKFGGRASGPAPLKQLFTFITRVVTSAAGRKLNSLECHDICTMIGSCVVSGGVRRSALISFSNASDQRMKHAKDGQFWVENPQRSMANNSVAYTEKPDSVLFMGEWINLVRSKAGERGFWNCVAARAKVDKWGRMPGDVRGNPCAEALLMDRQLCNLSEVVVRENDNREVIKDKIKAAVLLGCLQSLEVNFQNVSPKWKENCEAERLLGVSLTGLCDNPILNKTNKETSDLLNYLNIHAHVCSERFARELNIVSPKQVTLVKPSGTISQLCNCSSGLHARYSDYYIRRIRVTTKDPVAILMQMKGIPCQPEVGEELETCNTLVFEFPMKSPPNSVKRNDISALDQLEYARMINDSWCDGNPSCTVYVKDNEWVGVGAWVYKNWDSVCGLSFLPFDGALYPLAPYEEITKDRYNELCKLYETVDIDFDTELDQLENEDNTTGAKQYACVAGQCEL